MEELKPAIWFPEYKKYESMNLIENEETTIDLTQLKVSYVAFEGLIDEFSFQILLEQTNPLKIMLLGGNPKMIN